MAIVSHSGGMEIKKEKGRRTDLLAMKLEKT